MFTPKVVLCTVVILALNQVAVPTKHRSGHCIPVFQEHMPATVRELKTMLTSSLDKAHRGGGPLYNVTRIYSAKSKRVVGFVTNIVADLREPNGSIRHCQISILESYGIDTEMNFKCAGTPERIALIKTYD